MANLDIQGNSIEVETNGYKSPDYYALVGFRTPETDEDMVRRAKIPLSAESRQECTFDLVEAEINERIEEKDWNIEKITSIQVEEREKIKSGFDLD